jgi:hypothetical protein
MPLQLPPSRTQLAGKVRKRFGDRRANAGGSPIRPVQSDADKGGRADGSLRPGALTLLGGAGRAGGIAKVGIVEAASSPPAVKTRSAFSQNSRDCQSRPVSAWPTAVTEYPDRAASAG